MAADGSIIFSTELDNKELEKELGRLKQKILRLEESLTVGTSKKNALAEKLVQARQEYEKLQSEVTLSSDGKFVRSDETLSKMLELGNEIKQTEVAIKKQNNALEETQMRLDGLKLRYGEVAEAAERLNSTQTGGAGSVDTVPAAEQAETKMQSIFERMKASASEAASSIKLGLIEIANGFKNLTSRIASLVGSALKSIGGLAKNGVKKLASFTGKAAELFLSLFKGSNKVNSSFASGVKTMLKYSLGIRGLYTLLNKLRTALLDGFKNLTQYSESTNASISMIKSALTQLKNSFATAFTPILTTVAPILTQFINMLSTAADYVARLAAALSGQKSYARAIAVQENYAASLEGTADAAEEAAGSLASFDEINTITTENTSSANGSSGGVSPSEMFETVDIEPLSFDSWGEAVSSMLDVILNNGISKLKEAFSGFANWLNNFSANLYGMFTFPGVYDKVVLLGTELANALNGLVDQINWATLGGALGAGLNTAFGFLVSFIYTFDWMNLGASLATMLNNAVAEIDWYAVGQLLWAKFKVAIETLAGFLLNVDMTQLAQAASNIVMGFFNSATETLQSIDWFTLGEQVKNFLINIDWAGVAESVFAAIGAAFGAATAFLWGLIRDAWKEVVNWWHDTAYEDGEFTLQGLLDGIAEVISDIGSWLKEHVVDPFVNGFKDLFGIHSPSTVMAELGRYLMDGLLNGVRSMMDSIVATFSELWDKIKNWWGTNVKPKLTLAYWKEQFKNIGEGLKQKIKDGINAAITLFNKFISWVNDKLNISWSAKYILGKEVIPAGSLQLLNIPKIPMLAQGAVIPPNREFLAVLGDQTSGNNIEAPESLIRKIVREEAGGMNTELLEAILEAIRAGQVIKVGERVFGETAVRAINNVTRSAGKSVLLV